MTQAHDGLMSCLRGCRERCVRISQQLAKSRTNKSNQRLGHQRAQAEREESRPQRQHGACPHFGHACRAPPLRRPSGWGARSRALSMALSLQRPHCCVPLAPMKTRDSSIESGCAPRSRRLVVVLHLRSKSLEEICARGPCLVRGDLVHVLVVHPALTLQASQGKYAVVGIAASDSFEVGMRTKIASVP